MRYFLTLSYLGTQYAGWQRQPNALAVQEKIEDVLATILRQPIEITGCGRTDAGVHARNYVAHFDFEADLPPTFLNGVNSLLPRDIAVRACAPVRAEAHARFDAVERSYRYFITFEKDPFLTEMAWFLPQGERLKLGKMQEMAALLLQYKDFFPFCKSDSDAEHYKCDLTRAEWQRSEDGTRLVFHVTANRFLRGMVRLLVGAGVLVGQGKIELADVRTALDRQEPLLKSWSVPPQGLFLVNIKYPFVF